MRFFTHENTTKKERKKEITRRIEMETIFRAREIAKARAALLLFLETPFYFLRLYATKESLHSTTIHDDSMRRNDQHAQVPKGTSETFSSLAVQPLWYIVSDQKSTNRSRIGFTRTGVESSPPSGYKSKAPRFSFSFH